MSYAAASKEGARRMTTTALRDAINSREDDWIAPGTLGALVLENAESELAIRGRLRHVPVTRRAR